MRPQKLYLCLFRTLIAVTTFEIIAGFLLIAISEYTKLFLSDNIFQIEKHEALKVILIAKIYGLHVSICFSGGIIVILLFNDVYTRHLKVCTILWILLSIETVIGSLFMTWLYIDTMNYVALNFEESLKVGIKLYESDPQWVLIFDNLQYNYQCCGVYNHTDWSRVNFSPQQEGDLLKLTTKQLIMLPYSCARGVSSTKTDTNNVHLSGCLPVISGIIDDINKVTKIVNGLIGVNVVSLINYFLFNI